MAIVPNPALPTFPSALVGKPRMDPGVGALDPVIRTPMEDGFKSRQRFLRPATTGSYSILMTNTQFRWFRSWHLHKISAGSDWFNFRVRDGDSFSWEEVKMTSIYTASPAQNKYVNVSFDIVQRTDSIPTAAQLDAALT